MLVSAQSVELPGQLGAGSYVGPFTLKLFQSAGQIHECRWFITSGKDQACVSQKTRKRDEPEKPFVKLRPAYSVKLVFSYIVKGIKLKITAKFRDSEHLRFEDTKRLISAEKFRDFRETGPGPVCWPKFCWSRIVTWWVAIWEYLEESGWCLCLRSLRQFMAWVLVRRSQLVSCGFTAGTPVFPTH